MADKLREALEAYRLSIGQYANWKKWSDSINGEGYSSLEHLRKWAAVCDIMAEEEAAAVHACENADQAMACNKCYPNWFSSGKVREITQPMDTVTERNSVVFCLDCKTGLNHESTYDQRLAFIRAHAHRPPDQPERLGLTARGREILKQPAWDADYD